MKTFEFGNADSNIILIQPVDDHDLEGIENEFAMITNRCDLSLRLIAVHGDRHQCPSIMSSKKASLLYCTLIGVLIALYSVFRGLPFLIVVVVLFGLADSFGLSVVMDAYNKTRGKFEYSNNDALTMFIIMTRMGMTLAPGCILLFGNTLILSIIIILGIVLYVFTSRSKLDRGINEKS